MVEYQPNIDRIAEIYQEHLILLCPEHTICLEMFHH